MRVRIKNKKYISYYSTYYEAEFLGEFNRIENGYENKGERWSTRMGILTISENTKFQLRVYDNQMECIMDMIDAHMNPRESHFPTHPRRLPMSIDKCFRIFKKLRPERMI